LNVTQGESTSMIAKPWCARPGLDQRHELLLVAGEAARDEGGAERQREQHRVDRLLLVRLAFLRLRADVGRAENCPLVRP
jgi:hypothetical protein